MTETLTFTKIFLLLRHYCSTNNFQNNFSEKSVDDISFSKNSNFQLSRYQFLHQKRKSRKGGEVCVFVRENLSFKVREDLSINCDAIQSLSIEKPSTRFKIIILNTVYRPPNGDMKRCETHFKDVFSKNGKNLKNIVLAGDFNINFLDFETNKNVQDFLNLMFCYNMIPLTNKATRATRHSVNAIEHIITNRKQATMTLSQP